MKRIIVKNKYTSRLMEFLGNYLDIQCEIINEDELLENLPTLNDTIILAYGYDFYTKLVGLHKEGSIHIGLRKFNWNTFSELSMVHIGTNKLIFGKYPVVGTEPIEFPNGNFGVCETKLEYFFSKDAEAEPIELPEVEIVGIKEGIEILKNTYLTSIGTPVGFDFETNGFPDETGMSVSGFSLATKAKAHFFDFRKDYGYVRDNITQQNNNEYQEFLELAYQYLKANEKNIWTYNCSFEMHVCFNLFHKFIYFQDAYALTTCDNMKGSLKYNVQYYLKSPSWDDGLDKEQEYINALADTFEDYESFKVVYDGWESLDYDEEGNAIEVDVWDEETSAYSKVMKYKYKDDYPYITEAMDYFKSNTEYFFMLEEYWGDSWFACNPRMLGTYCCYDSAYTLHLAELLYPAYGPYCYKTFLYNKYIACDLSMSGINVDTKLRDDLEDYCNTILNNCYLYYNKFYLKTIIDKYSKVFSDIELTDLQSKLLGLTSEYKFMDTIVSTNKTHFGKALFIGLITDEIAAEMDNSGTMPEDLLSKFLGFDVTDETGYYVNAAVDGYKSFLRKRKILGEMGEIMTSYTGIDDLRYRINLKNLEVIRPHYEAYAKRVSSLWIIEGVPVLQARTLIEITNNWIYYHGNESIEADDEELNLHEKLLEHYPNITESDAKLCLILPDDMKDQVSMLIDINDPEVLREYLGSRELWEWVPETILNEVSLNTIYDFYNYCEAIADFKTLSLIKGNLLDKDLNTSEQVNKYLNFFSSNQFEDLFINNIRSTVAKWYFRNTIIDSELNNNPDEFNYDTFIKQFNELIITSNFDESDKMREYSEDASRLLCDTGDIIYPKLLGELPNMSLDLPEDDYIALDKFNYLYNAGSAVRKILNNYIKALHELVYEPSIVTQQYCTFTGVDGYDRSNTNLKLLYPYNVNGMDTKRTGSGYHTWKGKSDYNRCLVNEDGYISTYFDISQAEPRSVAYFSEDKSFVESYETGQDPYMVLANITWPEEADQEYFRDYYRPVAKQSLIAKIYGRGDAGLAEMCGVSVDTIERMGKALFSNWKDVARMRDHKMLYMQETGMAETYLGDRLHGDKDRYFTTAVNYPTQGNSACILIEGFVNSIINIRNRGYEIYPQTVIHDSSTNKIRIENLPEIDLCYRRYFRKYIKEKYGVNYEFDLDIMRNFRDKLSYNLDIKTHRITLSGNKDDVDYIMKHMQLHRKIIIESDEVVDNDVDNFTKFMEVPFYRPHVVCGLDEFNCKQKRSIVFIIDEPIIGEELVDEPLGEEYYFDKVCKWYENPVPNHEESERELGIIYNPNKVNPTKLANEILKRKY